MLVAVAAVVLLVAVGGGAFLLLRNGDGGGGDRIASVDDAEAAVVEITTQGSFVDPEFGEVADVIGSGSGFLIDPDGVVVTNNHVVTGAATIEVQVPGERRPRNARVLGRSECSDLAVIQLDMEDGEALPYLDWMDEDIRRDLEVYALGYPATENRFTVTRGRVLDPEGDGETQFSSVDRAVRHDAEINPGNSGGPLLTDDARVIGVNYFLLEEGDGLAISTDGARSLVERLRDGEDVHAIGINSQAVFDPATGDVGVWVGGVETGSIADAVGLRPGDLLTRMEGLTMGLDGTLTDYCDVLRSRDADAPMAIQVLRFDTGEILQGTLNGDPLEVAESFGAEIGEDLGMGSGAGYTDYVRVTDDTGVLSVEIPIEWAEVDGFGIELDVGGLAPAIIASTDLDGFSVSWNVPGVVVAVFEGAGDDQEDLRAFMEAAGADVECPESEGIEPYDDGLYVGSFEVRGGCGGTGAAVAGVVAGPPDGSFTVLVAVQLATEADLEALDRILRTFVVN